jgi:hypothetical protein
MGKAPEHRSFTKSQSQSSQSEFSINHESRLASETRASFSFIRRSSAKRYRRDVTTRTPDGRAAAARAFDFSVRS